MASSEFDWIYYYANNPDLQIHVDLKVSEICKLHYENFGKKNNKQIAKSNVVNLSFVPFVEHLNENYDSQTFIKYKFIRSDKFIYLDWINYYLKYSDIQKAVDTKCQKFLINHFKKYGINENRKYKLINKSSLSFKPYLLLNNSVSNNKNIIDSYNDNNILKSVSVTGNSSLFDKKQNIIKQIQHVKKNKEQKQTDKLNNTTNQPIQHIVKIGFQVDEKGSILPDANKLPIGYTFLDVDSGFIYIVNSENKWIDPPILIGTVLE